MTKQEVVKTLRDIANNVEAYADHYQEWCLEEVLISVRYGFRHPWTTVITRKEVPSTEKLINEHAAAPEVG
jgi:hypothetical protein